MSLVSREGNGCLFSSCGCKTTDQWSTLLASPLGLSCVAARGRTMKRPKLFVALANVWSRGHGTDAMTVADVLRGGGSVSRRAAFVRAMVGCLASVRVLAREMPRLAYVDRRFPDRVTLCRNGPLGEETESFQASEQATNRLFFKKISLFSQCSDRLMGRTICRKAGVKNKACHDIPNSNLPDLSRYLHK